MHATIYQIRVNSHLDGTLIDWFAPLTTQKKGYSKINALIYL